MFGLIPSSGETQCSVLFHIGSASIGVAISTTKNTHTTVHWQKRFEYGYVSGDDYNRYVRTMYATLLEAGMRLTSEGIKEVKATTPDFSVHNLAVHCVFSAPWFFSSTETEVLQKEKPFQVTAGIMNTIEQSGVSTSLKKQESLSWQELMGTPELLESYFDVVKLDGYRVREYENKVTSELITQAHFSFVSASVQEHVREVIERVLPSHRAVFFTSTRLLSNIHTNKNNVAIYSNRLLLLEVSGEVTSITLLHKGNIQNTATIPFGTNHILKSVSPKAVSANEAQSSLNVLLKKNKDIDLETLPQPFQDALLKWHTDMTEMIKKITEGVTSPADVFLFVDAPWQKLYETVLDIPWTAPGVRKSADFDVHGVTGHIGNNKVDTDEDIKMTVFSNLLR